MSDVIDDLAPAKEPGGAAPLPKMRTIVDFGTNPGDLKMLFVEPDGGARRRPLVVVLHGCTQTAESYDASSGWSELADRHDFLVLFPEQKRGNNHQSCFSWFEPGDTQRGRGEVESIRQMISTAIERFGADRRRVFICGLSAGGAMAGAMLATHPELFRGGAILAGLPYGAASNMSEAYEAMSSGRIKDAKTWGDLVRSASANAADAPNVARWPTVAIWHGTADRVVKPINAGELVKQWTNVHRIGATVPAEDKVGNVVRRTWRDDRSRVCVTEYSVPGLGHGAPVAHVDPPGPFFIPAGISSTWQIARDWGLTARSKSRNLLSIFGL
jgi:poly(hydroxyalkanoate) depolymerase family esterase